MKTTRWVTVLLVAGFFAACDSGAPLDIEPNTFRAEVDDGQETRTLKGTAVQAAVSDSEEFKGVFVSGVRRTRDGEEIHFSAIELESDDGEEIHLGNVREEAELQSGTFDIADCGERRPGSGWLSAYSDEDDRFLSRSGTLTLDVTEDALSGTFDITYGKKDSDRTVTVTGSFSAVPGEIRRGRDVRECLDRMRRMLGDAVRDGLITQEEARRRYEAAIEAGACSRHGDGDRDHRDGGDRDAF